MTAGYPLARSWALPNSARATVRESAFQSNSASGLGGALYTNGYTTTVTTTHSICIGNSEGDTVLLENVMLVSIANGIFSAARNVYSNLHNTGLSNALTLNCDSAGTPVTSNGFSSSSDARCALVNTGDQ